MLEVLLSLSLVKKDSTTRQMSVHRLVQAQFRYHMNPRENQEAFENAALLLHSAFPKKSRAGQMYHKWLICQVYVQHVLNLAAIFQKEAVGKDRLKPTQSFIELLLDCSR